MQLNVLVEVGVIILLATIFALIARYSKQPLIPAYILAGLILGPLGLGLLRNLEHIHFMSEMGIAFLLFVVGLEINIKKLKSVGTVAILAGLLEVILVFILGFFIAVALGFNQLVAIYLGIILALSSTMVVIKLLSDMNKVNTMHGRIIIGILLLQDLVAMFAIGLLTNLSEGISVMLFFHLIMRSLVLVALAFVMAKYIFPKIFPFAAKQKEVLFLLSVSTCLIFAMLAFSLEFSVAVGAFVAGVALGTMPYSIDIKGRVEGLKDFFATIFFVTLGAQLVLTGIFRNIDPLLIFLVIVIVLKPLILFLAISLFGYTHQVSFFSAISLAQISEFGLILATLGLGAGVITAEIFSLTVILTVLSIISTSYFMKHAEMMHSLLAPVLKIFDKFGLTKQELSYGSKKTKRSIILFGCNRMGTLIMESLHRKREEYFVVDNNPEIIRNLIKKRIACLYGDATNLEVLESVNLGSAKILISTVPSLDASIALTEFARLHHQNLKVVVTVEHVSEAFALYDLGADYVIVPHVISGQVMGKIVPEMLNKKTLAKLKKSHLASLEELDKMGLT